MYSDLVRYTKLYFPDGDVAITSTKSSKATKPVFRVHLSTIAEHSSQFANNLKNNVESVNGDDYYDNVPLVRYPDEPELIACTRLILPLHHTRVSHNP